MHSSDETCRLRSDICSGVKEQKWQETLRAAKRMRIYQRFEGNLPYSLSKRFNLRKAAKVKGYNLEFCGGR